MLCDTAVFYDIENLLGLFTVKSGKTVQLDEIFRRIREMEGVHGISIQRAYADWSLQCNRNLKNHVLQIGIEPVQIFNTNQNDKVKNAADVSLIIDAVDLLGKRPDIENYVIVSGDGIFAFLAKKLHEYGKRVIGCGFSRNTNLIFRNACDFFITLEKTDSTLMEKTPNGKSTEESMPEELPAEAPPTPKPVVTPTVVKPVPVPAAVKSAATPAVKPAKVSEALQNLPKNKYTEALVQAGIAMWKHGGDPVEALHVIKDVINVIFSVKNGDMPDLEISMLKTYVDNFVQGLKITHFKYKRFGEFIRFVLTGSPYCTYVAEGTTRRIARKETVSGKGTVIADIEGLQFILPDGEKVQSLFDIKDHTPFTYMYMEPAPAQPAKQSIKKAAKQPTKKKTKQVKTAKSAEIPMAEVATQTTEAMQASEIAQISEPVLSVEPEAPFTEAETETAEATTEAAEAETEIAEAASETVEAKRQRATESSIRRTIKAVLSQLSKTDGLTTVEVERLQTAQYAREKFGIRTPILKDVTDEENLAAARMVKGKVKYWKDLFQFNGRWYIAYKEWNDTLHRGRFEKWLKAVMQAV